MKKRSTIFLAIVMLATQVQAEADIECYLNISCDGQLEPNHGRGVTAENPFPKQVGGEKKCILSEKDKTYCNETCAAQKKHATQCSTTHVPQPPQIPGGRP